MEFWRGNLRTALVAVARHSCRPPKNADSKAVMAALKGQVRRPGNANLLIGGMSNNDHRIRDEGEFERVRLYVGNDIVRPGLAAKPADYR